MELRCGYGNEVSITGFVCKCKISAQQNEVFRSFLAQFTFRRTVAYSSQLTSHFLLQTALQPGVGLGLLYNMPPGLSVPCSISPFVYTHLSQVHGQVIQPSHSWSSSSSRCVQLSVHHFLGFRCLAFFLYGHAIVFFGI